MVNGFRDDPSPVNERPTHLAREGLRMATPLALRHVDGSHLGLAVAILDERLLLAGPAGPSVAPGLAPSEGLLDAGGAGPVETYTRATYPYADVVLSAVEVALALATEVALATLVSADPAAEAIRPPAHQRTWGPPALRAETASTLCILATSLNAHHAAHLTTCAWCAQRPEDSPAFRRSALATQIARGLIDARLDPLTVSGCSIDCALDLAHLALTMACALTSRPPEALLRALSARVAAARSVPPPAPTP